MSNIHATAIVDPAARIDPTATIGPYAVIGPEVSIGARTTVGAHCVIEGRTTIGEDNRIFQFASLGAQPQDKKYAGEPTELVIGHRNTIREFCTINTGTVQDSGCTRLGDDNWIMSSVHIAHDVQVGSQTILASYVGLAGHVQIHDWVIIEVIAERDRGGIYKYHATATVDGELACETDLMCAVRKIED